MDDDKKVDEVLKKIDNIDRRTCPVCLSKNLEVRNYDMAWHDGDIYCKDCGTYVRRFDAG